MILLVCTLADETFVCNEIGRHGDNLERMGPRGR
jgi:hypothetical protein